jgi:prepilin peptidase CpaA
VNSVTIVPMVVVTAFALVAAVSDFRKFRVPNVVTMPLLASGLLFHSIVGGPDGLQTSVLGVLAGSGILLALFVLGMMGAGDVKLMAGVGAWLGTSLTLYVFIIAAVATGIYSLVILTRQRAVRRALVSVYVTFCQIAVLTRHLGAGDRLEAATQAEDRRARLVPFGVMIAIAMVLLALCSPWLRP